jgi:hypothetical protein
MYVFKIATDAEIIEKVIATDSQRNRIRIASDSQSSCHRFTD